VTVIATLGINFATVSPALSEPTDPHKAFKRFVGTWTVTPSAPELDHSGTLTIAAVAHEAGLHSVFTSPQRAGPFPPFEEHGLWAYDWGRNEVHLLEVDSMGGALDFKGKLTASGDVVLEAAAAEDYVLERSFSWKSATEVQVRTVIKKGPTIKETRVVAWKKSP
jgi:hypothetical protein